jgi:hypothetical protein
VWKFESWRAASLLLLLSPVFSFIKFTKIRSLSFPLPSILLALAYLEGNSCRDPETEKWCVRMRDAWCVRLSLLVGREREFL